MYSLQFLSIMLKREGYDVFLVLEATIGFNRHSDDPDQMDADAEAAGLGEVAFSEQDQAFLKALKITVKESENS